MAGKIRLGRGLDSLIGNGVQSEVVSVRDLADLNKTERDSLKEVELSFIVPNESQVRKSFDDNGIQELAESIQAGGLIQPIVVKALSNGNFLIIAGERRYRALKLLERKTALVRVIDADEKECALISLIENLQRESLNPVEEANGFMCLIKEYGLTQEQVAQKVGKARASVANALRLLTLDDEALHYLQLGKISVGHAKVILSLEEDSKRRELLGKILEKDLSVRQTEHYANVLKSEIPGKKIYSPKELSEALMKIEKQMAQQLSANVSLQHGSSHGKIIIEYQGEDELRRIVQLMGAV